MGTLRAAKYCQIFGKSSKFPEIFAKHVLSDMRNGGGRYLQRICDNSSTDSSLIYHTKALFVGPLSVRPRRPFYSCSCDVRSNESKPSNYSLSMLRRPP